MMAHVHYSDIIMGTIASEITSLIHECLLNQIFRRRSKKTSKLRVTGLCVGNSPETGEFPAQMACNAKNVSIWWRHHRWNATPWETMSYLSNIFNTMSADDLVTQGAKPSAVLVLT